MWNRKNVKKICKIRLERELFALQKRKTEEKYAQKRLKAVQKAKGVCYTTS